jgi:hypothetical protein
LICVPLLTRHSINAGLNARQSSTGIQPRDTVRDVARRGPFPSALSLLAGGVLQNGPEPSRARR